jgi:di/tricarboxylate transporter
MKWPVAVRFHSNELLVLRLVVAVMIGWILRRSLRKKVFGWVVRLGAVGVVLYSVMSVVRHREGSSFSAIQIHFVSRAQF